jgi:hypothetical protein
MLLLAAAVLTLTVNALSSYALPSAFNEQIFQQKIQR